ncbi:MAG: hypothetical protein HDS62_10460 [Bacteroidales bacterium]|nr:hypothetical protein [Bacteroidales bacterium]
MRKKILSLALVAMTLVAANGFAQNVNDSNANPAKIENVKKAKGDRKDGKRNPYEGLTLSDAQKTKLQQLDEKRANDRKEKMQAQKQEKQRRDSDRMVARNAAKKEYLKEVKAIVGPDQYVVFLENYYINGNEKGGKAKMHASHKGDKKDGRDKNMKGRKDHKGKDGKKGNDKQNKRAANNQTASL